MQTRRCLFTALHHKHILRGCITITHINPPPPGLPLCRPPADIRINDLVVTGDGEHLVCVVSEKHLRIHRLADDVSMQINRDEPMTSLALCPDGSQLLVNLASHTINLWSMANLKRQLGKAGGGGAAGGSRIPGPPPPGPHSQGDVLVEYKRGRPEKQGRFVIRSAFGGSHSNFVVSGSEDSQVSAHSGRRAHHRGAAARPARRVTARPLTNRRSS